MPWYFRRTLQAPAEPFPTLMIASHRCRIPCRLRSHRHRQPQAFSRRRVGRANPTIAASHLDAFLVHLLTTRASVTLPVIEKVRRNLTTPPISIADYADSLARTGLPQVADLLHYVLPA
jgi:hypothetical protein